MVVGVVVVGVVVVGVFFVVFVVFFVFSCGFCGCCCWIKDGRAEAERGAGKKESSEGSGHTTEPHPNA